MNQYSTLVACLPPVAARAESVPSTSQGSAPSVPADLANLLNPSLIPTVPPASVTTQDTAENNSSPPTITPTVAKLEDLGSDDDSVSKLNKEPLPSTSKEFLITPDQQQQSVPSTSASSNSNSSSSRTSSVRHADNSEMSEIRRRRLEKFGSRTSSD